MHLIIPLMKSLFFGRVKVIGSRVRISLRKTDKQTDLQIDIQT